MTPRNRATPTRCSSPTIRPARPNRAPGPRPAAAPGAHGRPSWAPPPSAQPPCCWPPGWQGGLFGKAPNPAYLEKVLRDYPDVEVTASPGGRLGLKGYVETAARLKALREDVRKAAPQAAMQVHVAEDLVEQATRFIGDPSVSVMYAGKGRLMAAGSVEGGAARERIKQLNNDWQPAAFIEDKLSQRQPQAPQESKAAADAQAVAFWQSQLPSRLVSVTEGDGGLRHVQLANGHRYFEGSQLKSGAELKRIDADALDIRPAPGVQR